ncbi:zf-HC2 domain-containing protein [Neisseria zalophi]|uniref:Zf-HC2 domain-containing protein n=1 Tax=Neisseria zalophi TaxID=640030 RepID=A0A5J6Q125_9NEIS|nr:zf-HC2 domain-containing protein [Neisseria zalophi]QEY26892.1 zf-HC2 domain-containing protein [Neisseria zalophi]
MLKCKEACVLLSERQDRKLDFTENISLLVHLLLCPHCRRYRKQLIFIRKNMQRWQDNIKR